jgi:4-hydroxy-3-methylbut-2-enyl diphosphate reductase
MEDICYATANRQEAVKAAARQVEAVIVVGARNSSNSQRLREVAEREGRAAQLVADERGIDWSALKNVRSVAVTAGASAPEALVKRVLAALDARYEIVLETLTTTSESMAFPLPRLLREGAADSA